jgi:disulfide oxidoreductase YuzD
MSKVLVEVFNGINMGGGCCSCGGDCSAADVKASYESLVNAIREKYSEEVVAARYIDTTREGFAKYPEVQRIATMGYSYPITVIDGQPRLAGSVHNDSVLEIIEQIISGDDK